MSLFTLTTFAVTLWQIYRKKRSFSFSAFSRVKVSRRVAGIAALTLIAAYAAQIELAAYQAAHDGARSALFHRLPIALVYLHEPFVTFGGIEHDAISIANVSLVAVETAALALLCVHARAEQAKQWPYFAVAFSMFVLSITACTLTSTDALFYAYYSTQGLHGYGPQAALTPDYSLISHYTQLGGTIYGPLWIIVNDVVASIGRSVVQKVFALRLFNVILLLTALATLRALKISRSAQVAFILNPMLWFYFVVNAHNDFIAIVPCLASVFAVRRVPLIGAILIASAGCIKLPFLIIGCLSFAQVPAKSRRTFWIITSVCLCSAASWFFGGEPYFHHLNGYIHLRTTSSGPLRSAAMLLGVLAVFGLLTAAIVFNRFYSSAALLIASASPLIYPWYLSWGLPYALAGSVNLTAILLALPLAAVMIDVVYRLDIVALTIFIMVVSMCAFDAMRDYRRSHEARRTMERRNES